MYEKIVYNRLYKYLEKKSFLNKNQHGFQKGKSVITAITAFLDSVIDSLDKGETSIGIFMDLRRAFDSVDHNILLQKLFKIGIRGLSQRWFSSYLTGRKQFVEMTNYSDRGEDFKSKSNCLEVEYGVPQGSILGPLLYLCYVNDIFESLSDCQNTLLSLYADDANLQVSGKTVGDLEKNACTELENLISFFI